MYRVDITKVTKSTKNCVTTKTISETSIEVPNLGMAYMQMLQAFNEGYVKGYIINSTTGEVYMTFTREDSESGTNLNQWLSNELMAYMTKGCSICCIPEDVAEKHKKVDCFIREEDIYEDEVILSDYELRMVEETMYPRRNY